MKKWYFIGIAFIVMMLTISTVSAGLFDFLGGPDEKIIKIQSDDSSLSGKLKITEFKDIEKKDQYTFDDFSGGATNDIIIENGEGEYKLHEDTQFFKVDFSIDVFESDNSSDEDHKITVEYLVNNDTLLSSSDSIYADFCDVSFGGDVCNIDGQAVSLS